MSTQYPSTRAAITAMIELGYRARTAKVNGFTQYADFRINPIMNSAGERLRNTLYFTNKIAEANFRANDMASFMSITARLGEPWTVEIMPISEGRDYLSVHN